MPGRSRLPRPHPQRRDERARESADKILAAVRAHPLGRDAAIIGEVTADLPGVVLMKTRVGGTRIVDVLSREQLPRIC